MHWTLPVRYRAPGSKLDIAQAQGTGYRSRDRGVMVDGMSLTGMCLTGMGGMRDKEGHVSSRLAPRHNTGNTGCDAHTAGPHSRRPGWLDLCFWRGLGWLPSSLGQGQIKLWQVRGLGGPHF